MDFADRVRDGGGIPPAAAYSAGVSYPTFHSFVTAKGACPTVSFLHPFCDPLHLAPGAYINFPCRAGWLPLIAQYHPQLEAVRDIDEHVMLHAVGGNLYIRPQVQGFLVGLLPAWEVALIL